MHHSTARKIVTLLKPTEGEFQNSLARTIAWALPLPTAENALGYYAANHVGYVRDSASDINEVHVIDVPKLIEDVRGLYDARLLNAYEITGSFTNPIAPISPDHVGCLKEAVELVKADYHANGYAQ